MWAVQGRHNITQLSVQQIVSCDHVDAGCNGGDLPSAFKYVMQAGGLELEKVNKCVLVLACLHC